MTIVSYKDNPKIRKEVSHLLVTSFPLSERPPVKYFFKGLEKDCNNLYAFYDKDVLIGFTYIIIFKDICYIFFLAVSPELRNKGYGASILSYIKEEYKDYRILLCYEEINEKYKDNALRIRRKNFYQRNGFKDNEMRNLEFGVIYESGYIGKSKVSYEEYVSLYTNSFGDFVIPYIKKAD